MMSQATAPIQSDAISLWQLAKGIALVAIEVLVVADPPAAAALTAMVAVGDAIVAILQQINSGTPQPSNLTAGLDGQSKAVLLQSGPHFLAVAPNAAPMSAAPVNIGPPQ